MINIEKKITERFKFGLNLYAAVNNVKSILEQKDLNLNYYQLNLKKRTKLRINLTLSFL